jgi:WD40 repeat protein
LFDLPTDAGDKGVFTDEGRHLVTISSNGVLQVCELPSGRLLRQFGKYTTGISLYQLYRFQTGRNVVLAGDTNHVDLWNLDTFQLTGSWPHSIAEGNQFVVSEAGEWLLNATYGGIFTRINSTTKESVTRQLDINAVISMAFSPDGRQFAAGSWLGYVDVRQTDSFRPVAVLGIRRLPMFVSSFTPDGSRLLTCDYGTETLRLWDLKTQRELIVLEGDKADFKGNFNVQFSSDGNLLGVGYSGSLHVYAAPTLAEIDAAEKTDLAQKLLENQPTAVK